EHLEDLEKLKRAYQAAKRQRQLLDYDDLLVKLRELLSGDDAARRAISQSYRYILVDEYQDTNRLQGDLIRKLAETHDNVMVVGDDSQSIYGFRGATFRNIMEFPEQFPGATIYKLEENYRSTQPILNLANEIIRGAAEKYSKRLYTQKLDGPLPVLVQADRKSTRLNSSHVAISYAVFCLKKKIVGYTALNENVIMFRMSVHAYLILVLSQD